MARSTTELATPPLLDVDGLAERLGVTVRFVRRLVEDRRVPYVKVGRLVRFDPADVEGGILANCVDPFDPRTAVGRGRRC
jgi:excisionase family DNA binding protein